MKKLIHLIISLSFLFAVSMVTAGTEAVNFSSTGTDPCSVTINQDLSFTIPYAIYDGGSSVGQMELEINFKYFGEQNGQLLWQFAGAGSPPSFPTCFVSIEPDLSFTLDDAVYDAVPLGGQMTLQADFEYSGEQNGALMWYLADLKVDNYPNENPIDVDIDTPAFPSQRVFDADGESYNFIDDAAVSNYAAIDNFSADDTISFVNADVNDYAFSNEGEDVTLSYNYNDEGIMNVIKLTGIVNNDALVYDLASFKEAAGFDAFRG